MDEDDVAVKPVRSSEDACNGSDNAVITRGCVVGKLAVGSSRQSADFDLEFLYEYMVESCFPGAGSVMSWV